MTKLAIFGDVHARFARLKTALELIQHEHLDVALLVGDIGEDPPWREPARHDLRRNHDASVRSVISRIGETLSCPLVFVPGNHDLPVPAADVAATNADNRVVSVSGLSIAGLGGAGPNRFGFPYEWSEEEAEERLRQLSDVRPKPDSTLR